MPDPRLPADETAFLRHLGADPDTSTNLLEHAATLAASSGDDHALGTGTAIRAGRVVRAERSGAEVATLLGSVRVTWDDPVCTGDWVVIAVAEGTDGHDAGGEGQVVYLQPRRTAFIRRAADADRPQVLAANVDDIWIVLAADQPVSVARTERTLVLAWESGAQPIVVLTKADLAGAAEQRAAAQAVAEAGPDIPVLVVSAFTGDGLAALIARVGPGRTAALLGSSGAGKSSLVNALVGADIAAVGAVRLSDSKGRHTTSWRELAVLPGGGALIDTPGLRSVGLWVDEGGVDAAFADIIELEAACRFTDCAHDREPGCAVKAAIEAGTLPRRRLESYDKLRHEAADAEQRYLLRVEDQERRATAASIRKSSGRVRRR